MALDLRLPQTRLNPNDADERANRVHTSAALLDYHSLGHIRAQLTAGRWQRSHRAVVVTHNGAFMVSPGPVDKRFGCGALAGYPQAHCSTQ